MPAMCNGWLGSKKKGKALPALALSWGASGNMNRTALIMKLCWENLSSIKRKKNDLLIVLFFFVRTY